MSPNGVALPTDRAPSPQPDPSMAHSHDHDHDHAGLDVSVEHTGPCLATISFQVSPEEYQRSRQTGLQNIAKRTNMKGFRPGKAPVKLVEKHYGEQVDTDLTQHFVQHAIEKATTEHELKLAMSPRLKLEDIEVSKTEAWGHTFEVMLRPTFELGKYKGLEVESHDFEISEEDVEAALEDVKRQMSRPEPAGEDGLPEDGMAVCKLEFFAEGDDKAILERDGIRLNPGSSLRGVEEELFKKTLTGAQEGSSHDFEFTFPDDFPVEEQRGNTGTCRVNLSQVFRVVEPSKEEMLKQFDAESDEDLKTEIKKRMVIMRQGEEDQRIEQVLLDQVVQNHVFELPDTMVEEQTEAKLREQLEALAAEELSDEERAKREAEMRQGTRDGTVHALRAIYLMEEIARDAEIRVEESDVLAEFSSIASRNGVDIEEVRKYYQDENLLRQLGMELLERKVRTFLRENAEIKQVPASE